MWIVTLFFGRNIPQLGKAAVMLCLGYSTLQEQNQGGNPDDFELHARFWRFFFFFHALEMYL